MDDLRSRAQLVAFDPAFAAAGAIGTVVTRTEIAETAAGGEFPATLLLDLDRVETPDGGEVVAHATVAVDWDKESLDQLLTSTDDEEIALWFDERELAQAFDDVEAHGLRERAAVLAVAVAAAGASTTPALAMMPNAGGVGGGHAAGVAVTHQASGQSSAAQSMGAERGLAQDAQISGGQSAGVGVTHQTGGQGAAAQSMGAERGLAQDAQISGGQSSAGVGVTHQTGGQGAAAQSMGAERGLAQDAQISVQPTQGTSGGSSARFPGLTPPSSGELGAIAGVGAVLITAAGFGAMRRRTPPVQPA